MTEPNSEKKQQERGVVRRAKILKSEQPIKKKGTGSIKRRISAEERQSIRDMSDVLSTDQIAQEIGRSEPVVRRVLAEMGIKPREQTEQDDQFKMIKATLRVESFWAELSKQLLPEEIDFFSTEYCNLIAQFQKSSAVLYTEKMQIVDLVRTRILLNRSMARQKDTVERMEEISHEIESLRALSSKDKEDTLELRKLLDTRQAISSHYSSIMREIKELQQDIKQILVSLKGTRDQRIKRLDDINSSFSGFVRALDEEEFREREGREITVFRAAMEKERARLQDYHIYADGEVDIPLLTPKIIETMKKRDLKK